MCVGNGGSGRVGSMRVTPDGSLCLTGIPRGDRILSRYLTKPAAGRQPGMRTMLTAGDTCTIMYWGADSLLATPPLDELQRIPDFFSPEPSSLRPSCHPGPPGSVPGAGHATPTRGGR